MTRRGRAAGLVVLATLGVAPASAEAALRRAEGKTSQNMRAAALIRDDNSVERVSVRYRAKCRKPGFFVTGNLYWTDGPRIPFQRDGEMFSNGGRTVSRSGGKRLINDSTMSGGPAAPGWAGKFSIKVTVKRRGRTIDVCRTGSRSWRVGAPAT